MSRTRVCLKCMILRRSLPSLRYSTAQGPERSSTSLKWARPEGLASSRPTRPPTGFTRHQSPRTSSGDRQEDHRARVQPQTHPHATTSKPERSHEEVRQQYLARKKAREEASKATEVKASPPSSRKALPNRFATNPTIPDQNRWTSRKAQDKAKNERRVQAPTVFQASTPVRRRKIKSAHLQKVRSQLYLPQSITVSNLSRKLGIRLEQLQDKMLESGFEKTAFDHIITSDDATLISEEFNYDVIVDDTASFDLYPRPAPEDPSILPLRAPLVTIMGHVDHGKTTLLDTLRKSSVAAGEAGGITQHIGAFSVKLPGGKQITFLDTPGHSAFESMRQRGASVTDIVVLVVAADDSVMPQTREAIKHAHAAGVNMIVAINKMDKPGVNPEKVKRDLMAHGVEVEDYGGEIQSVPVSGLTGQGLDDLESAIVSLAEILDIRADIDGPPEGNVIESSVKKGRGNVATMIVTRGTLQAGSFIVAGKTWCRVRAMTNEAGASLKTAGPGTPVEVTGWSVLPTAGDEVLGAANEKEAKQVVQNRILRAEQMQQLLDIEAINEKRLKEREEAIRLAASSSSSSSPPTTDASHTTKTEGEESTTSPVASGTSNPKAKIEVPFIVKGDVSGSVEAIIDSISGIGNAQVSLKVIDSGVGAVTDSDILRAVASNGTIIAFGVPLDANARVAARRDGVKVIASDVIYHVIDAVRGALSALLDPIKQVRVLGEAEILKLFTVTTKSKVERVVAGCRITNGVIQKSAFVRVLRNTKNEGGTRSRGVAAAAAAAGDTSGSVGVSGAGDGRGGAAGGDKVNGVVYDGKLDVLKHVKVEVQTLGKGNECGMQFDGFQDVQVGDEVQCYTIDEIPRTL